MIAISALQHHYSGTQVLQISQWQLQPGAQALVLGPSGSGKTTLLHLLAGLLKVQQGRLNVAGVDLTRQSAAELDHYRATTLGIVLQRYQLLNALTVKQNLQLAQRLAGVANDSQRIDEVLQSLALLEYRNKKPQQLSGGQQQRVAIARAVLNKPKLILADEPTANLDAANAERVVGLLRQQAEQVQATLVITTHDSRIQSQFEQQLLLPEPQQTLAEQEA